MTLTNQLALKLRESPHHAQQQIRHWRLCSGEGKTFLDEADVNAATGQIKHQLSQVVQVAGEPIHRVADQRVAFPHKAQQQLQLWTLQIPPRGSIGERLIQLFAVELAQLTLVMSFRPSRSGPS